MYKVDTESRSLLKIESINYSDQAIWERHIQEWIANTPEVLEEKQDSLLIIARELPVNEDKKNGIHLDLLALDREGYLVVIELKRDEARSGICWQAIQYAARCSSYPPSKIVDLLMKSRNCPVVESRRLIVEHVNGEADENLLENDDCVADVLKRDAKDSKLAVRIILVASEFNPDVSAASLWLLESGIHISCIRLKPYKENEDIYLVPEQIIPLPVATDYTQHSPNDKYNRQAGKNNLSRKSTFSTRVSALSDDIIEERLKATLNREESSLTPRLRKFLEILLEENSPLDREVAKEKLNKGGVGDDIGHTGRLLSNISQYLTKPGTEHLRAIVRFKSVNESGDEIKSEDEEGNEREEGRAGAFKTGYKIEDKYRELVKRALNKQSEKG